MPRYIDADAAIDAARRSPVGRLMIKKHNLDGWLLGLPAADVAPVRHGHWEPDNDRYGWSCTACGHFIQWDFVTEINIPSELLPRYCPNCGALMDQGDNDGEVD